MNYIDRVYGTFEITEPVILELLATPQLKRLAGIDTNGKAGTYYTVPDFSRLEHSLGVMLLLRRYGATLEEQVAGLLHDVSHTAFSHTGDYIFGQGSKQDLGDNILESYIKKSSIPEILRNHQLKLTTVIDKTQHRLLETDLPDLCADRLDYTLRALAVSNTWTSQQIEFFLQSLIVVENRWVINDPIQAQNFVLAYRKLNDTVWASIQSATLFVTRANFLKFALEKNYICREDLWTTDQEVMNKIDKFLSKDDQLKKLYQIATNSQKVRVAKEDESADIETQVKSRAVDPRLLQGRYSDLHPEYKAELSDLLKAKSYRLILQTDSVSG